MQKTPKQTDAERGEVSLTINGQSYVIRFGMKFLKALTTQKDGGSPSDAMASLETAPFAALLDMVTLGIQLAVPAEALPAGFDADATADILDLLPPSEQENIFAVLLHSIKRNPIAGALQRPLA